MMNLVFRKSWSCAIVLLLLLTVGVAAQSGGAKGRLKSEKGKAIVGATVTVRQDGKEIKSSKTDSKGSFEITGIPNGTYNVVFEREGFSSGVKFNVEIKDDIVDLGQNLVLAVDPGSLVLINGSVFNQIGRSVTGAKIEIEKILSDGSTKKVATTYSNSSGEFTLRQPDQAAKFRITASLKGVRGSKEITVESAGIYRLAISLTLPVESRD